jgi:hypothetical protein
LWITDHNHENGAEARETGDEERASLQLYEQLLRTLCDNYLRVRAAG